MEMDLANCGDQLWVGLTSDHAPTVRTELPPTRSDSQTPDEMYFRKGNDIPNQLSDARTVARQARLAANRAVVCSKCALTDCVVQIDNKPNETG